MTEQFAEVVKIPPDTAFLIAGDWACAEGKGELEILGLEEGRDQINAAVEKREKALLDKIKELTAEGEEQARLLGMSASREAALLAKIDLLNRTKELLMRELERLHDVVCVEDCDLIERVISEAK